MKNLKHNIVFALILILITSCSTSNSVVSSKFLQKRKYNKGFYFSNKQKLRIKKGGAFSLIDSLELSIQKNVLEKDVSLKKEKNNKLVALKRLKGTRGIEIKEEKKIIKNKKNTVTKVKLRKPNKETSKRIKAFLPPIRSLKSNTSRVSNSANLGDLYYWDWNAILIVIGVITLVTLLIMVLGWPAFLALLGQLFLYLLIAVICVIIVVGLVVVSFGLVLLLGENFMSSLLEGLVEGMLG